MITSIEIGKNYSVKLLEIYGGTTYNLTIIGSTDIDNVAKNDQSYNIFDTYFSPIGLGLTSYYAAINSSTKIYICGSITSLEPFEVDTDTKVFVPESLIDFDSTEEFVKSLDYTFTISSLKRRYTTSLDKTEFDKDIKEKIIKRLDGLIDISTQEINLNVASKETYLKKSDIDTIETNRKEQYELFLQNRRNLMNLDKVRETTFNETISEMKSSKQSYDLLIKQLQLEKDLYTGLCVSLQNKLDKLNN